MTAPPSEHLVFVWSPSGYTLSVRPGEPPALGSAILNGERTYRVARVAPSPLPHDPRACAYLLPVGAGDEAEAEEAPPLAAGDVEAWERTSDLAGALASHPAGACVVTIDAEGRRLGIAVDSLVSLSDDPPLVAFAIPHDEPICDHLREAGGCAITLLAGGQAWLARHFAGSERPIAMWRSLAAEPGAEGAPLFVGALGWLECSLEGTVTVESSTLFVCEVRSAEAGAPGPALVRVRGRYLST